MIVGKWAGMVAGARSVFVSYAGPDRVWAEWVAWQLRDGGHRVELDVWDWRTGDNFVTRMTAALEQADAVVALFSNNYFAPGRWTGEEWTSVVANRERLVPVTIEPLTSADIPDMVSAVLRKDLHGLDESAARAALLEAVNGPTVPLTAPGFPGGPASGAVTVAGSPTDGRTPRLPSSVGMPQAWRVARRNPHFTGREEQLGQVRDGLLGGRQAVVQALHGLGGIGKTQIALEYAHRFASQYDIVWWIDAEQSDQLAVRYNELATRLGLAKPDAGAEHNARTLLEHLRTRDRWLIILDNAEDPEAFESMLPGGPGHVLITSRNPDWAGSVRSLDLGVFTRAESLAYLTARAPGLARDHAEVLADALGDLPLALAQAAGVITTGMTPDRYRRLLTERTASLLRNGLPQGYPAPLAATVDIATTRLANDHPEAAAVLRLGAFFGPEPIPTAWLETARDRLTTVTVDPDDFMWPQTALQALARYGLARVDHEAFQIHRLTQAILRDQTGPADTAAAEHDVAAVLTAATPEDPENPTLWPRWAALTAHLTDRQDITTGHPQLRRSLTQAVLYLLRSGQARTAHQLTGALRPVWAEAAGADDPDTLTCAQYLAHATVDLGRYAEALPMVEDVLERRRLILGEDHPDTLRSAHDLAATLSNLGRHTEALPMVEDVLGRRRLVLGDDHPQTLDSAYSLAVALHALGRYDEALPVDTDVLGRRRLLLGDDHPQTLDSAHSLAVAMDALGRFDEALPMKQDVLERRRLLLGDDHPQTLDSAHGLAVTLHALGRFDEALPMKQDVLERRRLVLGDDHPDTLRSAHSLAVTLYALRNHEKAIGLLKDTRSRSLRVLGNDHPDTVRFTEDLTSVLTAVGRQYEAQKLRRALGKPGQQRPGKRRQF
ncbi:FxSxx-COOH system tetratricopeptide repeat protein [Kitasatospora sp. NPDC057015]|uniref:FxSxx-COOH system tetratricopeptide repeat protein n=1 Tax=Kitasatospora sp. NPDC057015 TaxID=3346001 RepID=UPI00362BA281